jgi:hypothetical protein
VSSVLLLCPYRLLALAMSCDHLPMLRDAMGAILRADVSWEATIDGTFTSHTGDIRNTREVSAVLANRCIGSQRQHAPTT